MKIFFKAFTLHKKKAICHENVQNRQLSTSVKLAARAGGSMHEAKFSARTKRLGYVDEYEQLKANAAITRVAAACVHVYHGLFIATTAQEEYLNPFRAFSSNFLSRVMLFSQIRV